MTKQKVGVALFWIAVVWIISWGVIGSIFFTTASRTMTMDELNQTMWAPSEPWFFVWGILGVPVGALVAFIGVLLHSGAKGSTVWKYGLVVFLALVFSMSVGRIGHFPPVFGFGGTLILLFFIGILRLWAKERIALKEATAAADLKLTGYVFFLIAAWFTCGFTGMHFLKAYEGQTPTTPLLIMVLSVMGWFCLFLGHYKARKKQD